MHILISSPLPITSSCSSSTSVSDSFQDQIFLNKQIELRKMYCKGEIGINLIMEQMYKLGKRQGEKL